MYKKSKMNKLQHLKVQLNKKIGRMSMNKALSARRKEKDIFKLKNNNIKVTPTQKDSTYQIQFKGPKQTPYEKGKWTINLYLPDEYPYKSPSVGFLNKIFHPNIDFASGSVCLDVINQTWTPMYELVNIFQIFLPQLLTYPNPASPLNHDAATLYEQNIAEYNKKVIECIEKHAFNEEFKEPLKSEQVVDELENEQKMGQIEEEQESEMQSGSCSLSERDSINEHEDLRQY